MAISFQCFADPGLTQPITSLDVLRPVSGGAPGADRVIYIGSPFTDSRYLSASAAEEPIYLWPLETVGDGAVLPSHISLALSAAGLDSATPGEPVALPNTINCGPTNAIPVHVRVLTPALASGEYAQVMLQSDSVYEAGV